MFDITLNCNIYINIFIYNIYSEMIKKNKKDYNNKRTELEVSVNSQYIFDINYRNHNDQIQLLY